MKDIRLEKFQSADFNKYYSLVGDEQVMAMITERAWELYEAKLEFDLLLKNNEIHKDFGRYKVIDRSTGKFVGFGKLEIETPLSTSAELGYMILPYYWQRGYATAIATHLVAFARQHKQIERLTAIIDPQNIASRKVLVNSGFHSLEITEWEGLPAELLGLEL